MRIFKPQNHKGQDLVPLTSSNKIDNKYLLIDSSVTETSENAVSSKGIWAALAKRIAVEDLEDEVTETSSKPVKSSAIYSFVKEEAEALDTEIHSAEKRLDSAEDSILALDKKCKSLEAELESLKTWIEENFLKGQVVDSLPEDRKQDYLYVSKTDPTAENFGRELPPADEEDEEEADKEDS